MLFGDGATSSDGFHAGMNIAGVHRLPVVFLCRNNQYAISLPLEMQTASKTIAIKAEAYGFAGIRIDGNDANAVYSTTEGALARARAGEGPTLIEAVAYRLGSHTTSDDARRYRTDEQVAEWRSRDAIETLRRELESHGVWDSTKDRKLREELARDIDSVVDEASAEGKPSLETLFEDVYAQMPRHLREQRDELLQQSRTGETTP